jgi:hypothetical protein
MTVSKLLSFTNFGQTGNKKPARRKIFPTGIDKVMRWDTLEAAIAPFCPKLGNGGRHDPLSSILRIYCLKHLWNFDIKAHIGVDARSGLVHYLHNLHPTPSNTADVKILLG